MNDRNQMNGKSKEEPFPPAVNNNTMPPQAATFLAYPSTDSSCHGAIAGAGGSGAKTLEPVDNASYSPATGFEDCSKTSQASSSSRSGGKQTIDRKEVPDVVASNASSLSFPRIPAAAGLRFLRRTKTVMGTSSTSVGGDDSANESSCDREKLREAGLETQSDHRRRKGPPQPGVIMVPKVAPPAGSTRSAASAPMQSAVARASLEQDDSMTSQTSGSDIDPILLWKILQGRDNREQEPNLLADEVTAAAAAAVAADAACQSDEQDQKLPGAFAVQPPSAANDNELTLSSLYQLGWEVEEGEEAEEEEAEDEVDIICSTGRSSLRSSFCCSSCHSSCSRGWQVTTSLHGSLGSMSFDPSCNSQDPNLLPIAAEVVEDVDMEAEIKRRVQEELQTALQLRQQEWESQLSSTARTTEDHEVAEERIIQGVFGATAAWRSSSTTTGRELEGAMQDPSVSLSARTSGSEDVRYITSLLKGSGTNSGSERDLQELAKNIRAALKRGDSSKCLDGGSKEHAESKSYQPKWKLILCCFGSKKKSNECSS